MIIARAIASRPCRPSVRPLWPDVSEPRHLSRRAGFAVALGLLPISNHHHDATSKPAQRRPAKPPGIGRDACRHCGSTRLGADSKPGALKLPQDTVASQVEQWVGRHAAAIDYQFKHQAQVVDGLLNAIGEVKANISKLAGQSAKN